MLATTTRGHVELGYLCCSVVHCANLCRQLLQLGLSLPTATIAYLGNIVFSASAVYARHMRDLCVSSHTPHQRFLL